MKLILKSPVVTHLVAPYQDHHGNPCPQFQDQALGIQLEAHTQQGVVPGHQVVTSFRPVTSGHLGITSFQTEVLGHQVVITCQQGVVIGHQRDQVSGPKAKVPLGRLEIIKVQAYLLFHQMMELQLLTVQLEANALHQDPIIALWVVIVTFQHRL